MLIINYNMNTFTKIITGGLLVCALTLGAQGVSAQGGGSSLQGRVAEMRQAHADLKAQVEAGDITREEARSAWQSMIAELRAEKEAHFEAKRKRIEAKYQDLLEKNPERAAVIKEHLDAAEARRAEAQEQREAIRAQVESGEITKQEARTQKMELLRTQREAAQNFRSNIKEKREEFQAKREERQASRPGNGRPVRIEQ